MNHPENQKQHRVPQVYLKHFGFEVDGVWKLSVWDRTKDYTEIIPISIFSTTINEFDGPYDDFERRRHFEKCCSIVENKYKTIIKTLENQKQLTLKHKVILCDLIASLICRGEYHRWFFGELLQRDNTRDKFFQEMLMFDDQYAKEYKEGFNLLEPNEYLNFFIGAVGNHIARVMRAFSATLLLSPKERAWFTSDNPVVLEKNGNSSWIIPIESDLYLPLSRELCLYMYLNEAEVDNPLRKLKTNKIHLLDEDLHTEITNKICLNKSRYLIYPGYMGPYDFKEDRFME